jgi:hypothetical protein
VAGDTSYRRDAPFVRRTLVFPLSCLFPARFKAALRAPLRGSGTHPTAWQGRVIRRPQSGGPRLPQPNHARMRTFGLEPDRKQAWPPLNSKTLQTMSRSRSMSETIEEIEAINQAERKIRQTWIERCEERWEKPLQPFAIELAVIPEEELPF